MAKMADLERSPLNLDFDFEHYKKIHEYLFDDLYEWAREIRTVNISKKGTSFTPAKDMEKVAESCFGRLKNQKFFKSLDFDDFVNNIVDFYCDSRAMTALVMASMSARLSVDAALLSLRTQVLVQLPSGAGLLPRI